MAFANSSVTDIIATTIQSRSGEVADNFTNNNALLRRLKAKGNVKPFSGGRTIVQELEYANNTTYKRYSGYEVLNIQPSDVFTAAEFPIRQAAVAVSISGLEMLQNSGKEKMLDLLESRIGNAERTRMGIEVDDFGRPLGVLAGDLAEFADVQQLDRAAAAAG